jgi:hypothetical protein
MSKAKRKAENQSLGTVVSGNWLVDSEAREENLRTSDLNAATSGWWLVASDEREPEADFIRRAVDIFSPLPILRTGAGGLYRFGIVNIALKSGCNASERWIVGSDEWPVNRGMARPLQSLATGHQSLVTVL